MNRGWRTGKRRRSHRAAPRTHAGQRCPPPPPPLGLSQEKGEGSRLSADERNKSKYDAIPYHTDARGGGGTSRVESGERCTPDAGRQKPPRGHGLHPTVSLPSLSNTLNSDSVHRLRSRSSSRHISLKAHLTHPTTAAAGTRHPPECPRYVLGHVAWSARQLCAHLRGKQGGAEHTALGNEK